MRKDNSEQLMAIGVCAANNVSEEQIQKMIDK